MDPFSTLGLKPAFDVDVSAAEKTHRELSRALHPDRYVGAGASERRAALGRAVEVNEAWRIIRDPIARAEALLRLRGVELSEAGGPEADPEFLMEMLEMREALADARHARDLEGVRGMADRVQARSRDAERLLAAAFARDGSVSPVGKLSELRFYRRFLDEVSAIEEELAA